MNAKRKLKKTINDEIWKKCGVKSPISDNIYVLRQDETVNYILHLLEAQRKYFVGWAKNNSKRNSITKTQILFLEDVLTFLEEY